MKNAILENKNLFDVSGKVVLITGAGSGLGKGYAHVFAEAGSTVICTDQYPETAQITADGITADGGKAKAYLMDVRDNDCVNSMVDRFIEEFGRIGVLVNNAGVECAEPFLDVTPEHFDMIFNVNLRGGFFVAQTVAKKMAEKGGGKIINIASLASHIGIAESTVYTASKGAVLLYTKALALEMIKYNVQVNTISPGYYRTPLTEPFLDDPERYASILAHIPMGRIGTVRDLAGAILFLASSASDYVTGIDIIVDGGWLAG